MNLLWNVGMSHSEIGQYDDARNSYEDALKISRELGNRTQQMRLLDKLASVCDQLQQYDAALKHYQDASVLSCQICDSDGIKENEMLLSFSIGLIHWCNGKYCDAKDNYEDALEISRELGDREQEMCLLDWLGSIFKQLEQYEAALEHYQAASVVSRTIRDSDGIRDVRVHKENEMLRFSNIGKIHFSNGKYCDAKDNYEDALEISRELGDKEQEMRLLDKLGSVCEEFEQYGAALEHYQAASLVSHTICDSDGIRDLHVHKEKEMKRLGYIGGIHYHNGKYSNAKDNYEGALEISRELGDRKQEMCLLDKLGLVCSEIEQYEAAFEHYQAALIISHETGDQGKEMKLVTSLGFLFLGFGQYCKAIEMLQAASNIAHKNGDRKLEKVYLIWLGEAYYCLGQYSNAIGVFEACLKIARKLCDKALEVEYRRLLGNAFWECQEYETAQEHYRAYFEIARKVGQTDTRSKAMERDLSDIGAVCLTLKQYQNAKENIEAALKISRETGNREAEGRCLFKLGDVYFALKQCQDAIEHYHGAMDVYDSIWKDLNDDYDRVSFDDTSIITFSLKRLQKLHLMNGDHHLALECCEKARSRALKLLLNTKKISHDVDSGEDPDFEAMREIAVENKSAILMYSLVGRKRIRLWVIKSNGISDLLTEVRSIEKAYKSLYHLVELIRRLIGAPLRGRSIDTDDNNDLTVSNNFLQRNSPGTPFSRK